MLLPVMPALSFADDFSPALLQIKERQDGWVDVTWKKPIKRNNAVLSITPVLPEFFEPIGSPVSRQTSIAWVEHSTYLTGGNSLTAATLSIDGLNAVPNEVLIRVELSDGAQYSTILRAGNTTYVIPEQATKLQVSVDYWLMGAIHILEGADHLLFVFALLLIVTGLMPLFKAVTAFTVAHSITLALATLGMVNMPSAPTEAIIALSIVFLAAEIVHQRQGRLGVTERWPWLIAFIFGLFHGLGFAGALSEIGLPQHEIPLALLMFNVGVETGQLLFIVVVISLMTLLKRLPLRLPREGWRLVPYSIGGVAAFWTIDRVMSFTPL
jgi:hydrogenase/urease accessory protein HupE